MREGERGEELQPWTTEKLGCDRLPCASPTTPIVHTTPLWMPHRPWLLSWRQAGRCASSDASAPAAPAPVVQRCAMVGSTAFACKWMATSSSDGQNTLPDSIVARNTVMCHGYMYTHIQSNKVRDGNDAVDQDKGGCSRGGGGETRRVAVDKFNPTKVFFFL